MATKAMNCQILSARTPMSGHQLRRSTAGATARGGRRCGGAVRVVAKGEPEGFKRNAVQQFLKDADDAVKRVQAETGESLMTALEPIGKAAGLKSRKGAAAAVDAEKGTTWPDMQAYLTGKQLESVSPGRAAELIQEGYVLVDVRPREDFERFHPEGAINVPLNQYITSFGSPMQIVRRAAFAAQAVKPIEPNPDFESQLLAGAKDCKGMIFGCNSGGTIRPTPNFPRGQASRSLISACMAMRNPELPDLPVVHLQGGLNTWFKAGFDGEGVDDAWEDTSGRTPSAAGFTPEQDAEELK